MNLLSPDSLYSKSRGKQDAEKGVQFMKLPPVLTIHLKRFEFDMQRMVYKNPHIDSKQSIFVGICKDP